MRIGIPPEIICVSHLLGEHGELHKFRSDFVKRKSIKGRIDRNQIEPASMKVRHNELAIELMRRWPENNIPHRSPYQMPDLSYLPTDHRNYLQDRIGVHQDYLQCPACRALLLKNKHYIISVIYNNNKPVRFSYQVYGYRYEAVLIDGEWIVEDIIEVRQNK